MEQLNVKIKNIKHIVDADITIPFDNGLYTFVGANGAGKSTLMLCLSRLVTNKNGLFSPGDTKADSSFSFIHDKNVCIWKPNKCHQWTSSDKSFRFNGMYEGSLFYGTRFEESLNIEKLIKNGAISARDIADTDDFVKDTLSYILHGNKDMYRSLKRIKNRRIAEKLGFTNLPHFIEVDHHLVSQYRMSSGECLLISLLHFLYNSIVRKSLPVDQKVIVMVDEIELALHPIAVVRLLDFLNGLIETHGNLIVYLSTHSPEIIKMVPPKNLYRVISENGVMKLESNCYPSYLIRDLYSNVSPDFLVLVEDELAMLYVNRVLTKYALRESKLIHVVPVGGWQNVLDLHKELYCKKILGTNTKILSILDGDVEGKLTKKQKVFTHCFIPIMSVEKYLYSVIKLNSNPKLRKIINDKYFIVRSLNEIVADYNDGITTPEGDNNKTFYSKIIKELESIGTKESVFVSGLCDDIENVVDAVKFVNTLRLLLS